jgi:hypothetical protein
LQRGRGRSEPTGTTASIRPASKIPHQNQDADANRPSIAQHKTHIKQPSERKPGLFNQRGIGWFVPRSHAPFHVRRCGCYHWCAGRSETTIGCVAGSETQPWRYPGAVTMRPSWRVDTGTRAMPSPDVGTEGQLYEGKTGVTDAIEMGRLELASMTRTCCLEAHALRVSIERAKIGSVVLMVCVATPNDSSDGNPTSGGQR